MSNLDLRRATIDLLQYVAGNSKGERIVEVGVNGAVYSLYNPNHLDLMVSSDQCQSLEDFNDLPDEVQYYIYCYIDANKHNLQSREAMIELPSWEDMNWKAEPLEVKGQDGQVIGRIGTGIVQKKPEGDLLAVIFISADNTWSTLTMYQDKDDVSRKTAMDDLARIGTVINCLATTL